MPKYTLTEEEEERLRALSPTERLAKFAYIESEISSRKLSLKSQREAARDYIGELEAQRRFLASRESAPAGEGS